MEDVDPVTIGADQAESAIAENRLKPIVFLRAVGSEEDERSEADGESGVSATLGEQHGGVFQGIGILSSSG